jgi:hypothetical protein
MFQEPTELLREFGFHIFRLSFELCGASGRETVYKVISKHFTSTYFGWQIFKFCGFYL